MLMMATTLLPFSRRPDPQLQDLPTYALWFWWLLCTAETLGISSLLYQIGQIFNGSSLLRTSELQLLLHQSVRFYVMAGTTAALVFWFAVMGAVFAHLSAESGMVLLKRMKGEKQANWRVRSVRKKYLTRRQK